MKLITSDKINKLADIADSVYGDNNLKYIKIILKNEINEKNIKRLKNIFSKIDEYVYLTTDYKNQHYIFVFYPLKMRIN